MEVRGGKPLNPKSKNTVIREKTFLILILVCHSQTLVLFCSFWNSQKKILASVYERSYESSIIPPSEKPLLKILAARWFLLLWGFAFEKIRAKRVHSCLCSCSWGVGGEAPDPSSTKGTKSPLCMLAYYFFKSIVSTLFPLILIFFDRSTVIG